MSKEYKKSEYFSFTEKESFEPSSLDSSEFSNFLKSQVQVSKKKQELIDKIRRIKHRKESKSLSVIKNSSEIENSDSLTNRSKEIPAGNQELRTSQIITKLDPLACHLLFILDKSSRRNMISDFEIIKDTKIYSEIISSTENSDEAYFKLGKIKCFEGDFSKSILYLTKAFNIKQDPIYNL